MQMALARAEVAGRDLIWAARAVAAEAGTVCAVPQPCQKAVACYWDCQQGCTALPDVNCQIVAAAICWAVPDASAQTQTLSLIALLPSQQPAVLVFAAAVVDAAKDAGCEAVHVQQLHPPQGQVEASWLLGME